MNWTSGSAPCQPVIVASCEGLKAMPRLTMSGQVSDEVMSVLNAVPPNRGCSGGARTAQAQIAFQADAYLAAVGGSDAERFRWCVMQACIESKSGATTLDFDLAIPAPEERLVRPEPGQGPYHHEVEAQPRMQRRGQAPSQRGIDRQGTDQAFRRVITGEPIAAPLPAADPERREHADAEAPVGIGRLRQIVEMRRGKGLEIRRFGSAGRVVISGAWNDQRGAGIDMTFAIEQGQAGGIVGKGGRIVGPDPTKAVPIAAARAP